MSSETIIERLFNSFNELQSAITRARTTLSDSDEERASFIKRLDSYDEILDKQRCLADELTSKLESESWDEVSRIISLINGLSTMIRDDARAILTTVEPAHEDINEENQNRLLS